MSWGSSIGKRSLLIDAIVVPSVSECALSFQAADATNERRADGARGVINFFA